MASAVLITGGAGFIGRALIERCLLEGQRVAVIDNLCAGRREHLEPYSDVIEFFEGDILDETFVSSVMAQARPELVFHLAAHHFIPFCNAHPNETLRVNVEGTHVVLSEAARHEVRVAAIASTGAIYPSVDQVLTEDMIPQPSDVYALSKHLAEQVARFIADSTNLSCVVTRLFNTYGPYETNPHLIPHIIECLHGGPVVELGNTETQRDYIFVSDVAELVYASARSTQDQFSVVNVGTGVEYSAKDIIDVISSLIGSDIEIQVDPNRLRSVDKRHQRADTTRLHQLTGMRPRHTLVDGLCELLAHEKLIKTIGD